MDRLSNYGPATSVLTLMMNSRSVTTEPFKTLRMPLGTSDIRTPEKGVTTIRVAACAVNMVTPIVGTLRVDVDGLPIPQQSVVQQVSASTGVTMAYIPVEFSDRAAVADANAQPIIQLLGGIRLIDIRVTVEFKPLNVSSFVTDIDTLNLMLVMETDGSRRGNQAIFT